MSRLRFVVSVAVVTAAIAFPLGALAAHQFSDVPTSSTYHADIDALVDSGVTSGCGGDKFCPTAFVTREQMAAFMNRLGALGPGKTPVVNADRLDGLEASQFVRGDVAVSGSTSCTGASMNPEYSNTEYSVNGPFIYPTGGEQWFMCQLHVPDGATLTSFSAYLQDLSDTSHADCELFYTQWSDGGSYSLADPPATSDPGTPGFVVTSTTSFVDATVDNDAYMYWAECGALATDSTIGIHGIKLTYEIEGSPEE